MTSLVSALDEKALEKAVATYRDATVLVYPIVPGNHVDAIAAAIRAYIAALPAVGEPVAWLHPTAGWAHRNKEEISPHCLADGPGPQPLYPASSLAALQSRIKVLEDIIVRADDRSNNWMQAIAVKAGDIRAARSALAQEGK